MTGTVLLGPADTYRDAVGGHPRTTVQVVGSDGLAQACALELALGKVSRAELFLGPGDALVPGLDAAPGLTVHRCPDELAVIDQLGRSTGGDRSVLVIESTDGAGFSTEKLLERMSVDACTGSRLATRCRPSTCVLPRPRANPAHPELRGRRGHRPTWVESSYFTVFSTVYFQVMPGHEAVAEWPAAQRLAVAHRIASRLCHVEVLHPDDLWSDEAGAVRRGAVPMSGSEAVEADRAAAPPRGPLVGVLRFGVHRAEPATHVGDDDEVITVEVEVPPTDRRIGLTDLLVGLPCL